MYIYNGRPIESRRWSIERRHFQWPWTTPNQVFRVTLFVHAQIVSAQGVSAASAQCATAQTIPRKAFQRKAFPCNF